MKLLFSITLFLSISINGQQVDIKNTLIEGEFKLPNVVAPLDYEDDQIYITNATEYIPVKDEIFIEHVRGKVSSDEQQKIENLFSNNSIRNSESKYSELLNALITSIIQNGNDIWIGTENGLYIFHPGSEKIEKYNSYGIKGPLSTNISDIVLDSKGTLWFGTPIGLSLLKPDGAWSSIRGSEGLPVEEITALAIDKNDRIWIGTTQGAILYTPYEEGRQWYYRAGKRYLINDVISDIILSEEGMPAYFSTEKGISKIEAVERTLAQKAEIIENRINKWHRRMGLVAACSFDDAENPTSHTIKDNDNDGLWTSYHVVAMSLAYGATGKEEYKRSAMESMHAMIMLQNASGIPGLVAR
ncbi:hypothetical protein MNBD_IGNAVI01-1631, partial [hydrothermal vent metagenome]